MFYGSRKWGLWPRGVDLLRLRRITSSPSQTLRRPLVRTTDDGRRGECSTIAAVRSGLFFTLRDSYGWQHCRPVCSEARYSSRIAFFAYPPAFVAHVRGVPVGISPPRLVWKTRMVWLPEGEKILKMFIRFDISTNVTDGQTPHDSIGRAYA